MTCVFESGLVGTSNTVLRYLNIETFKEACGVIFRFYLQGSLSAENARDEISVGRREVWTPHASRGLPSGGTSVDLARNVLTPYALASHLSKADRIAAKRASVISLVSGWVNM